MHTAPALSFKQISYEVAGRLLLDDFSLTIVRGEWFCLLGRSGTGKSTLARIGVGLIKPHAGEVWRATAAGIGYMAQSPGDIIIGTTVFEETAFGPQAQGLAPAEVDARVGAALALVGLDWVPLQTSPHNLSGGQQQLLGLAALLASKPALLVLDEPTSMLDAAARSTVLTALRHIVQTGTAVLHITHRAEEALWAHRAGVLAQGRLVDSGTPADVLSDPVLLDAAGTEQPELLRLYKALEKNGIMLPLSEWSVEGMYEALYAARRCPVV